MLDKSLHLVLLQVPIHWFMLYNLPVRNKICVIDIDNFLVYNFSKHSTKYFYCMYLMCVCVYVHTCVCPCHDICVEVRGQLVWVISLFLSIVSPRDGTQIFRPSGKCSYLLNHLLGPNYSIYSTMVGEGASLDGHINRLALCIFVLCLVITSFVFLW